MTVGFDVSQTGKGKAGCGYFADGLIGELAASDSRNEYILYPAVGDLFWDPDCAATTFNCRRPNFRRMAAPPDFETSRRFWRFPGPDFETRLGAPDVFHSNNFYCPRGLARARLVYTLYDLSFIEDPSWTTEQNRIGCFQGVFEAAVRADLVVAISKYTRRHFLSTFPHYPASRVRVVYPASRFGGTPPPAERPRRFENLEPGGFWLSVGTIEPRKNHARLLDAYRLLKAETGSALPLVLAGGNGWLMEHFETCLKGLEPGRDIILPGYVTDTELQWLLSRCHAFVYPSLFEGFGMPVLEALSCGALVLCSETSSLPEAAGEAGLYFDPLDARSIAAAMLRVGRGEVNREGMRKAAREHARLFSWNRSAAEVARLYDEVLTLPRFAGVKTQAGELAAHP